MAEDFDLENVIETINLKDKLGEFDPVYLHIKCLVEAAFCDPDLAARLAGRIIITNNVVKADLKLLGGAVIDKQLFLQLETINGEKNLMYITDIPKILNGKPVKKIYSFSDYSTD